MIKSVVLNHGLRYTFRLHSDKIATLHSDLASLGAYLQGVFDSCHEDIFIEGPRSSALRFSINVEPIRIEGHEVCAWAGKGLREYVQFMAPHEKVQLCMLENDPKTLAVEVPIWVKEADLIGEAAKMDSTVVEQIFNGGCILTGHIDILSLDGKQVWVWDYKPRAGKERYAATQVFFYALMLSKRAGLPLEKIRCGYFDDKVAYVFKPSLSNITER